MLATAAIVLAAGQGTRMRSRVPKVLHPLAGRPMIDHVLDALAAAGVERPVVVTGFGAEQLEEALQGRVPSVRQDPQLGTADAVRCGLGRVPPEARHVLVTMGDVPLLPGELFQHLLREQAEGDAAVALLSAHMEDATGYGRIVRGADGDARAIVEEADADEQTRAINEVNVGAYCFDAAWLRANVGNVPASPSGEYYLTDLVAVAIAGGRRVAVVAAPRAELTTGINDRIGLAAAERLLRQQIAEAHMRNGVTIVDPATTTIDAEVEIGQDARIEPGTILAGATVVAQDAVIGRGRRSATRASGHARGCGSASSRAPSWRRTCRSARMPMSAQAAASVPAARSWNHAELKNSSLGAGTKQHHFSYLGDAEVGRGGQHRGRVPSRPTSTARRSTGPSSATAPSSGSTRCCAPRSRSVPARGREPARW